MLSGASADCINEVINLPLNDTFGSLSLDLMFLSVNRLTCLHSPFICPH